MRKLFFIGTVFILAAVISGCSTDEVIRVGSPFEENGTSGVSIHKDITDTKAISRLRTVIDTEKKIDKPSELNTEPDTFFTLDRSQESVSEVWRYIWYQDDGSSILSNEESVDLIENGQDFFTLTEEQTNDLKGILE